MASAAALQSTLALRSRPSIARALAVGTVADFEALPFGSFLINRGPVDEDESPVAELGIGFDFRLQLPLAIRREDDFSSLPLLSNNLFLSDTLVP